MSERLIFTISENLRNPEYPKRHIVKIRKSGRQLSLFPYFSVSSNKWCGRMGSFFMVGFLHSRKTPSLIWITKEE